MHPVFLMLLNRINQFFPSFSILGLLQLCAEPPNLSGIAFVLKVHSPSFTFIEFISVFFHILVQFVKVNISQYRANDTTLRCSAVRSVKRPIFDIACFQKLPHQPDKAVVCDAFFQNSDKHIMVDVIEKSLNVALDKPLGRSKILLHLY